MSDLRELRSRAAASTQTAHHYPSALRVALAGIFVVVLVGAAIADVAWSSQALPATFVFATAIMIIAAAVVGWERQVDAAESAGLVKHYDQHPMDL
ncbi:hypothetical protein BH11ACT7_BH11ACT7_30350 [soil metagenome]